jgi:hypothetical protein
VRLVIYGETAMRTMTVLLALLITSLAPSAPADDMKATAPDAPAFCMKPTSPDPRCWKKGEYTPPAEVTPSPAASEPAAESESAAGWYKLLTMRPAGFGWYVVTECEAASGTMVLDDKQSKENHDCKTSESRSPTGRVQFVHITCPRSDAEYFRTRDECLGEIKKRTIKPDDYK